MSIHAKSSEEAQARLENQQRNSTILSFLISSLAVVLIFLGLGFFLLPGVLTDMPGIKMVPEVRVENTPVSEPTPTNFLRRNPTPPSSARAPVIVSQTASPVSIPTADVAATPPSADFGNAEGFGDDWGTAGEGPPGGFELIPTVLRKRCSKEDRIARLRETGGNPLAEDAVEKGLEWLMATQNADGSWTAKNQSAMTGFAVLSYLGRCETPRSEKYGDSCLRGIAWLIDLGMKTDGKLSTNPADKHWPYEHAIATYALCEAATFCNQLGIPVPGLTEVATKATEFILANQHSRSGGWDYSYDRACPKIR